MSESLLRFLSLRCFVSLSRTRGLLGFANLRRPFVGLVWSLNCRKCITSPANAQGGFEKKLKKVLGGLEWGESEARSAGLSRAGAVAGASLEALCLVRSVPLPLVRARGAHCKTAAHGTMAKPMKDHSREGPRLSRPMRRAGLERKNMKWFRNGTSFLLSCSESVTTQEEGGKANQEQHT